METADAIKNIKKFRAAASAVARAVIKRAMPVWTVLTFSPARAAAPASCLCAEIGKGQVAVIYAVRVFSKYRIKAHKVYKYTEEAIPTPDETASAMAVAMKDFGVRAADVVLVVPKSWVVVKTAVLPVSVEENLKEVVAYEFDRFTPFSADEALYDYLIEKKTDDSIVLLIAAAKASALAEYISSLLGRGLSVGRVAVDASCLATACRFGAGYDSFIIAEAGKNGIRSASVDAGMLKAAAFRELRTDDDNAAAGQIGEFLAGQQASAGVRTIISFSEDASTLKDLLKASGGITFEELNGLNKKMTGLEGRGVSLSLAGAALEQLWPGSTGFNLLSRGFREGEKKPFLLSVVLASALIACLLAYLFVPLQTENDRLSEIERQINLRKSEVNKVEQIKGEIEAINKRMASVEKFKHGAPLYIDMIKELTRIIPKNSWLTRIRISGPQASIEGYSPSATTLIQLLEASKYFHKVEFASPTFRDARMNMDRFQIKMEIRGLSPTPETAAAEAVNE